MKSKTVANIFSVIMTGGIFVLLYVIFNMGLPLSVVLGGLGFLGLKLLFRSKKKEYEFVASGVTKEQVHDIIINGKHQVKRIRGLSHLISNQGVKDDVKNICDTADEIFEDFKKDPKDIKSARKFLNYYLDTTEKILKRYVDLSNSSYQSEEIKATLKKVEEILRLIDKTFKEQLHKLLEDDIFDLDVELSVLEKTINSEGV